MYPLNGNSYFQYCAIEYLNTYDKNISLNLLEGLKNSSKLDKENEFLIEVVICNLKNGEEGLINLFKLTNDSDVKYEIIKFFDCYKSKSFAELLISVIQDENCENYIRNRSYDALTENFTIISELIDNKAKELIKNYEYK